MRFKDGVFNHALAVAKISANNVTLNSKSNQSVPYLVSSVPIFLQFLFQDRPLSWLLRLFLVLVIVLYIYVSFSCCYNNVYSYKHYSLNLVTQLLLFLRIGLLRFMYDVRNYKCIRYVCVYGAVSPVKKENRYLQETQICFASLYILPISILLDQLQIEVVS